MEKRRTLALVAQKVGNNVEDIEDMLSKTCYQRHTTVMVPPPASPLIHISLCGFLVEGDAGARYSYLDTVSDDVN